MNDATFSLRACFLQKKITFHFCQTDRRNPSITFGNHFVHSLNRPPSAPARWYSRLDAAKVLPMVASFILMRNAHRGCFSSASHKRAL